MVALVQRNGGFRDRPATAGLARAADGVYGLLLTVVGAVVHFGMVVAGVLAPLVLLALSVLVFALLVMAAGQVLEAFRTYY
jgi:hypothetical protein